MSARECRVEQYETDSADLNRPITPGEIALATFMIARDPVTGFRVHLRTYAAVVEHLRTDPRGRDALCECLDRLMEELKRQIGAAERAV